MSGVPMRADTGHAFSSGASRERGEEGVEPSPFGSAPAPVSFRARKCFGGTGEWATVEYPAAVEVAVFPTLEAAQAYALSLGLWLDQRPDPSLVEPFFVAPDFPRAEPSFEGLEGIFERMLRPETKAVG